MPPSLGRGAVKQYQYCLSHGAAALGYRQVGCLKVNHVRTADPSADGRRSAASRTAIGRGDIVSQSWSDNLFA